MLIRETQGDTLQGVIDGVNTTYQTTYDFIAEDHVSIYVNGRLKIKDWDDGFSVVLPNQVELKIPLLAGDSLEVEYKVETLAGGGADGGCPSAPETVILRPDVQAGENVPEVMSDELKPEPYADDLKGVIVYSDDLAPRIVATEEN